MAEPTEQRVALVTGGNRGIGLEIARACKAQGFRVLLAARDEARGRQAAEDVGCDFVRLDLDDEVSIRDCAAAVEQNYGQIDALVNNASIAYKHADTTSWRRKTATTIRTNFFGTLSVCEAFMPLVRSGGCLVTVASSSGHLRILRSEELRGAFAQAGSGLTVGQLSELMERFLADVEASGSDAPAPTTAWPHVARGWPNHAYGVSKLAQIALARVHARELAARGIAVFSCCPGNVATDMSSFRGSKTPAEGADTPAWLALRPPGAVSGQFFVDRRPVDW